MVAGAGRGVARQPLPIVGETDEETGDDKIVDLKSGRVGL
ncbi:MAG: hypothetical protein JWQ95_204 [Sphaerisporangium sp.]|jgi:hypothetical protein|nr:hypothetical protein [Sphaerisporangium sp.]